MQPLKWDDALAAAALHHAERMARESELSHQYPGEPPLSERAAHAGARFSEVAENIAVGPAAE
ncbi:MAG: CAP domain-containing protein, partial [Candidatus Binataceae bacterium]